MPSRCNKVLTPRNEAVEWRAQRGNSSVGRARPCQGRGRGFESLFPLQFHEAPFAGLRFFRASQKRMLVEECGTPSVTAGWQSGYAADCKSAYAGSIPTQASSTRKTQPRPPCGNSSVGRARPCQGRGREFESRFPLQIKDMRSSGCHFKKFYGALAKRLCSGLQIRLVRFDSGTRLHFLPWPDGGIGRHNGFKIPRRSRCVGSSPTPATMGNKE